MSGSLFVDAGIVLQQVLAVDLLEAFRREVEGKTSAERGGVA